MGLLHARHTHTRMHQSRGPCTQARATLTRTVFALTAMRTAIHAGGRGHLSLSCRVSVGPAYARRPFGEYLASQRIPPTVARLLVHAIALADDDRRACTFHPATTQRRPLQ
jgi:hypothetical protein